MLSTLNSASGIGEGKRKPYPSLGIDVTNSVQSVIGAMPRVPAVEMTSLFGSCGLPREPLYGLRRQQKQFLRIAPIERQFDNAFGSP